MFDCVMPTQNGQLFTSSGKPSIKNARYRDDPLPIDGACACAVCGMYSRAYVTHLSYAQHMSNELLGSVLNSLRNVSFYLDTMKAIRQSILLGTFNQFRNSF